MFMFNAFCLFERQTLNIMAGSEIIDGMGREKGLFDSRKIIGSLLFFLEKILACNFRLEKVDM